MRLGLACAGLLLAGVLAPRPVVAQTYIPAAAAPMPPYSMPSGPVGPPGYIPYNPPAELTYGATSPFRDSERLRCLRASALSGVVASNDREVVLRFGRDTFYRVRLTKACPALLMAGAHVAEVTHSSGGLICRPFDVELKVVAGDDSVSHCTGDTLSKMSRAEVKTASASTHP